MYLHQKSLCIIWLVSLIENSIANTHDKNKSDFRYEKTENNRNYTISILVEQAKRLLVLFKFIGESKFEVQVFDPTGCEKINDPMKHNSTTKTSILESDNRNIEELEKAKIKIPTIEGPDQNLRNGKFSFFLY